MRTIPDRMRTDEVYVAAFGSFIFIILGFTLVKWARGRAPPCPGCGDPRVMFVDISPPDERVLWVRRSHEGVGTDEETTWTLGYASSGCVSQKLRPTACGRQ